LEEGTGTGTGSVRGGVLVVLMVGLSVLDAVTGRGRGTGGLSVVLILEVTVSARVRGASVSVALMVGLATGVRGSIDDSSWVTIGVLCVVFMVTLGTSCCVGLPGFPLTSVLKIYIYKIYIYILPKDSLTKGEN
jgi:hypothetical protein